MWRLGILHLVCLGGGWGDEERDGDGVALAWSQLKSINLRIRSLGEVQVMHTFY